MENHELKAFSPTEADWLSRWFTTIYTQEQKIMSAVSDLQAVASKIAADIPPVLSALTAATNSLNAATASLNAANATITQQAADLSAIPAVTAQLTTLDASLTAAIAPAPVPVTPSLQAKDTYKHVCGPKAMPGLSVLFDSLIAILTSPTALAMEKQIALGLWAELQAKVNELLNATP